MNAEGMSDMRAGKAGPVVLSRVWMIAARVGLAFVRPADVGVPGWHVRRLPHPHLSTYSFWCEE